MARGSVFHDGTTTTPRLDHPEGVAVHPDGSVWCGGEAGQIYRISPDGQTLDVVAVTGGFVLGIAFAPGARYLYACDLALRAVFRLDTRTGALDRFAEGTPRRRFGIPNYPVVDAGGQVYVSDSNAPGEPGPGIFRFRQDGTGELWYDRPLAFANGLALDPDGAMLYVVESFLPGVSGIPIRGDGSPGEREEVVALPGTVPDGLAFGPDGRLYIGCYEPSQVLRVDLRGDPPGEPARGAAADQAAENPQCTPNAQHRPHTPNPPKAPRARTVQTVLADETAHLLCHPTNLAFRGEELFTANLGRWHITRIDGIDFGAGDSGRGDSGRKDPGREDPARVSSGA
jgi:gluconolactonase